MAVITISRQFGAGGKTLGEMLAEKLGYSLFDDELIQMVAEKAKVSAEGVATLEHEAHGKFQKFISKMHPKSIIERVREKKTVTLGEVYVDILHDVIGKIAEEGDAVVIGRGSQYILHDRPDACHILVTAGQEARINLLVKKYNLTVDQAKQTIAVEENRRNNLYEKFGRTDFDTPTPYHMVFNTSKVSIEKACKIVCAKIAF